jgi:hypothetical protein
MTHDQLLGIWKHRFVAYAIGLQHIRRGFTNTLCCHVLQNGSSHGQKLGRYNGNYYATTRSTPCVAEQRTTFLNGVYHKVKDSQQFL